MVADAREASEYEAFVRWVHTSEGLVVSCK